MIETGRLIRARRNCGVRKPLKSLVVMFDEQYSDEQIKAVSDLKEYVRLDLNVEEMKFEKAGRGICEC